MTTMATGSPAANAPTDPYAQFEAGVGALLADDPATWTLQELHDRIEGLHTIMNQVESVSLAALASYDARGGAQIAGHRTTGDWLATTTRTTSASAGWRVHTARALRDYLPHTAQALADGDIDTDHIRAIRRARRILGDDFDRIEETVVKVARTHNITDLRALVDLIIQQYRPEAHDNRAEDDRERRKVDLSRASRTPGSSTGSSTRPPVRRLPRPSTCTRHRPAPMTSAALDNDGPTLSRKSLNAPPTKRTGRPAPGTSPSP